jgi:hypothetical protein
MAWRGHLKRQLDAGICSCLTKQRMGAVSMACKEGNGSASKHVR